MRAMGSRKLAQVPAGKAAAAIRRANRRNFEMKASARDVVVAACLRGGEVRAVAPRGGRCCALRSVCVYTACVAAFCCCCLFGRESMEQSLFRTFLWLGS